MHPRERAANLAAKQHGVITVKQALNCGMTRDQVRQQVRSGRWIPDSRGTHIVAGSVATWEQRTAASVLAAGPAAAASHLAAAWLHGLIEQRPERIDVTVPHDARNGRAGAAILHRTRILRPSDVRRKSGIPVTCPSRTLVDIAGVLQDRPLAAALDRALLKGLVSIPALRRYIDERGLRRKPGVGRLIKLLDDREFGVPESELEREFLAVVRDFHLPEPVRQQTIGAFRVDFVYADARVVIEVDGRATHGTSEAFEEDPVRQNALVLEGWTIVRFTWKQLRQRPEYVVDTITALLARGR